MMSRSENRLTITPLAGDMASVTVPRMHDDEVDVDDALVGRLLSAQLPELAHLPLTRIEAWGTDHAIFRLGDDLSVRLPKIGWAAKQGEKESRWLCDLAPHLPIEVPVPLAVGAPADGYPFPWYVSPWLGGENPTSRRPVDLRQLAVDLAAFVLALQLIDTTGAPPLKRAQRGGPLAPADGYTREQAARL
ncbi:MAG: hypothetical protein QOI44_1684, partial [Actinomycetota bacterium]|nr:hypothetical protein [Actinomycetota bacterium]